MPFPSELKFIYLQVVYPFALKQDVMALLEEHITENVRLEKCVVVEKRAKKNDDERTRTTESKTRKVKKSEAK